MAICDSVNLFEIDFEKNVHKMVNEFAKKARKNLKLIGSRDIALK